MGLIVNADDFGKNEDVNKAIAKCFENGITDRTTIMINMPCAKEACEISKEQGFMDRVGLHINLTEGSPLTDGIKEEALICDEDGSFNALFMQSLKHRLYMPLSCREHIKEEIRAQIDRYHEMGFSLDHLDSHHHVHTNAPILKVLRQLSKEYDFRSIRISRNLYQETHLFNDIYKYIYNASVRRICRESSRYFGSFNDVCEYFSYPIEEESMDKIVGFCQRRDLEIMVHPMYLRDGTLMDSDIPMKREKALYEACRENQ